MVTPPPVPQISDSFFVKIENSQGLKKRNLNKTLNMQESQEKQHHNP